MAFNKSLSLITDCLAAAGLDEVVADETERESGLLDLLSDIYI
jgi:hypothetical protein